MQTIESEIDDMKIVSSDQLRQSLDAAYRHGLEIGSYGIKGLRLRWFLFGFLTGVVLAGWTAYWVG